ncbi:MAG TPA: OmpA family protein [Thermoanaerobaculia bacterium]
MKRFVPFLVLVFILGSVAGCATNKSVEKKIAEAQAQTEQKIESVTTQVEELQSKQRTTDEQLEKLGREASEALRRAEEAGILAKGKVVFAESFIDDRVKFNLNSDELSNDSLATLREFAQKVKSLDTPVFIEIQGHTDSTGPDRYNEGLGEERAEAVRRFLSREEKLPLVRMSTISYGETLPAANNKTRDGRKQNRRVVLVVLE